MAHALPTPTSILVCFAVPEEAAPFRPLRPAHAEILVTGMGAENARRAFESRLRATSPPPTFVLTCGFAGGLDPALPRGCVVHQADPDSPISRRLVDAGSRPARFHLATRVAVSPQEKARLRRSTGADVVEMESGVLRELCRERALPSATVRVVSDAADDALPLDFNTLMTPDMRLHFGRLAARLVRHPGAVPGLLRLRRHALDAARQLAITLSRALADL